MTSTARLRAPRRQLESVEQLYIRRLIAVLGGRYWVLGTTRRRTDHPGTMQTPGAPDLLAFLPVRGTTDWLFVMIEVKAPRGRLRPAQDTLRECCRVADVAHVTGPYAAFLTWCRQRGLLADD